MESVTKRHVSSTLKCLLNKNSSIYPATEHHFSKIHISTLKRTILNGSRQLPTYPNIISLGIKLIGSKKIKKTCHGANPYVAMGVYIINRSKLSMLPSFGSEKIMDFSRCFNSKLYFITVLADLNYKSQNWAQLCH